MSEQVNKEQTKGTEQEKITELSDEQLAEAQGGQPHALNHPSGHTKKQRF